MLQFCLFPDRLEGYRLENKESVMALGKFISNKSVQKIDFDVYWLIAAKLKQSSFPLSIGHSTFIYTCKKRKYISVWQGGMKIVIVIHLRSAGGLEGEKNHLKLVVTIVNTARKGQHEADIE